MPARRKEHVAARTSPQPNDLRDHNVRLALDLHAIDARGHLAARTVPPVPSRLLPALAGPACRDASNPPTLHIEERKPGGAAPRPIPFNEDAVRKGIGTSARNETPRRGVLGESGRGWPNMNDDARGGNVIHHGK